MISTALVLLNGLSWILKEAVPQIHRLVSDQHGATPSNAQSVFVAVQPLSNSSSSQHRQQTSILKKHSQYRGKPDTSDHKLGTSKVVFSETKPGRVDTKYHFYQDTNSDSTSTSGIEAYQSLLSGVTALAGETPFRVSSRGVSTPHDRSAQNNYIPVAASSHAFNSKVLRASVKPLSVEMRKRRAAVLKQQAATDPWLDRQHKRAKVTSTSPQSSGRLSLSGITTVGRMVPSARATAHKREQHERVWNSLNKRSKGEEGETPMKPTAGEKEPISFSTATTEHPTFSTPTPQSAASARPKAVSGSTDNKISEQQAPSKADVPPAFQFGSTAGNVPPVVAGAIKPPLPASKPAAINNAGGNNAVISFGNVPSAMSGSNASENTATAFQVGNALTGGGKAAVPDLRQFGANPGKDTAATAPTFQFGAPAVQPGSHAQHPSSSFQVGATAAPARTSSSRSRRTLSRRRR